MADYDVLAGLNRMLESRERREQTRLQTSLAMMQFAQQKRMQDIQVAGQQLQVLQTANEQMVSGLANDFLQRSGLEALYSQFGGDTVLSSARPYLIAILSLLTLCFFILAMRVLP